MKTWHGWVAGLACGVIASAAGAQGKLDSNNDGSISYEELQTADHAISAERFATADADGDGLLNRQELHDAVSPGRRGPREHPDVMRLDTDGDGMLSLAELQASKAAMSAERFTAADSDGSGLLSREEMRAVLSTHAGRERHADPAALDTDGDGMLSLPEMQAAHPQLTNDQFIALDANGDGLLAPEELKARGDGARRAAIGRLDVNGDGGLSLEELKAAHPQVTEEQFQRMDSNGDGVLNATDRTAQDHGGMRWRARGSDAG
jgi:EF hand